MYKDFKSLLQVTQANIEAPPESMTDTSANINPADFRYVDIDKDWINVIKPVIQSEEAQAILHRDLKEHVKTIEHDVNQHYAAMGSDERVNYEYTQDCMPRDWDCSDWRYSRNEALAAYHEYVCTGASESTANTLLFTACTAYPDESWSLVGSEKHCTVWNGKHTLFDMHYQAMNISPMQCYEDVFLSDEFKQYDVGQYFRWESLDNPNEH